MKYQFFGKKIPYKGKTLWEILGNLKDFGVGRYIQRDQAESVKEPCFFKIIKVQPVPPPRDQFHQRRIIVWVDEWFRGLKREPKKLYLNTDIPKYRLIPKDEEENFLKAAEEITKNFVKKEVPKYSSWPPLFKILWERQHREITGEDKKIPNLESVFSRNSLFKIQLKEDTCPPTTCDMHKFEVPVEDKIKEIIELKRKIKRLSAKTQTSS